MDGEYSNNVVDEVVSISREIETLCVCALCLHLTFTRPRVDRPGNHTLNFPREAVKDI